MAGHGVLSGHFLQFPGVGKFTQGLTQTQQNRLGKLTKGRVAWKDQVSTPRGPRKGLIHLPSEPAEAQEQALAPSTPSSVS